MTQIFMNTVLLERNRWTPGRDPSLSISEWLRDFQKDGFDGIELWENHAVKATEEEVHKLQQSTMPIEIYNSYVRFEDEYEEERAVAANMVNKLDAKKVKFNLGSNLVRKENYIQNLLDWKELLPEKCELLCECHPGTVMEDPATAEDMFARLGLEQLGAIVHPFHADTDLHTWFVHLGSSIVHAHVSLFENGTFYQLNKRPEVVKERLCIMKEAGYKGTFSLEFTEGTAKEYEIPELLYKSSIEDLTSLKNALNGVYVS